MKSIQPTNTRVSNISNTKHKLIYSMSYSRGTSVYKISCEDLGVPAGVVIGRGGGTINLMKSISRAQIRIRKGVVEIKGGHREMITAKSLLQRLKDNLSNGIVGLNISQPTRKPRRKIRVKTNTSTGWSNVEATREAESKTTVEPKKVTRVTQNSFAGLDFDSDSDSEESSVEEEQPAVAQEENEEFPALPTSPAIKLTIREKQPSMHEQWLKTRAEKKAARADARLAAGLPATASWADICDEEDERRRMGLDSDDEQEEGLFLQSY